MNIRNLCPKYFMPKSKEDHFCMIEFFLFGKQKQMNQRSASYFRTVKTLQPQNYHGKSAASVKQEWWCHKYENMCIK